MRINFNPPFYQLKNENLIINIKLTPDSQTTFKNKSYATTSIIYIDK